MRKTQVLLLHGAIGSNAQLKSLKNELALLYEVHAPNFPGHGGEPGQSSLSMRGLVDFTKAYIDTHSLQQPILFGYSMGGYLACCLSLQYPGLIGRIITLATKFHWDDATAAAETKMLQPDILEQKVPKFAEALAQQHGKDRWKELLHETASMLQKLGANPILNQETLSKIATPSLLIVGDRDKMVGIEETVSAYRAIPGAQFAVLPETPHPIEQAPIGLVAFLVNEFIGKTTI